MSSFIVLFDFFIINETNLTFQIFVHKIVINSCTDYFLKCEQNGLIVNGALDMPDDFAPDSVAAIIR